MLAGESATTIAAQARRVVERVLHREHPAPGLPDHGVPAGDAELRGQLDQLVLEELRRPELGGRVGQVLALAAADLVVEDAGAAVPAQLGDRLAVVVCGSGATVADDDRRLRRVRIELAHDLVPGLVLPPLHQPFTLLHLTLLSSG